MYKSTRILPAVPIVLKGVLREKGETYVVFAADGGERIIEAELYDILDFHRFRLHVWERFDLRIVYREGKWFSDVVRAFYRAGLEITAEDLTTCVWINERDMPESEARWMAEATLLPLISAEIARLEEAR